uniref:G-protein coupled receptors family 1 profile domain-containing protein n=1 Tax=Equus asinus TaxID=9793 RepID=A0A9L0J6R6_EQUAS
MVLFEILFFVYVIILMGNSIIVITRVDQALQTPMYFFQCNISYLEICYVSVTLPITLWIQKRNIVCMTQMSFVLMLGNRECLLLTALAYDHYVAICDPLRYPLAENHKVCVQLVAVRWVTGVPAEIGQACQIFSLHFCRCTQINHFFCDVPPILKLACGGTFLNGMLVFTVAVLFVMISFWLILGSYSEIISTF